MRRSCKRGPAPRGSGVRRSRGVLADLLEYLTMATEVVYARVPGELKDLLEGYAADRGISQSTAIAALLESGTRLEATAARVGRLERQTGDLEEQLAAARHRVRELELETEAAAQRERELERTYRVIGERADQPIGVCPACRTSVRGYDVLVTGKCSNCGAGLSTLFSGAAQGGLDQSEFLFLLGALGAVVAIALLIRSN